MRMRPVVGLFCCAMAHHWSSFVRAVAGRYVTGLASLWSRCAELVACSWQTDIVLHLVMADGRAAEVYSSYCTSVDDVPVSLWPDCNIVTTVNTGRYMKYLSRFWFVASQRQSI
jgi:hypothetical protein